MTEHSLAAAVINSLACGVVVLAKRPDGGFEVVDANPAAIRLLGDGQPLVGRAVNDLLPPVPSMKAVLLEVLNRGEDGAMEAPVWQQDAGRWPANRVIRLSSDHLALLFEDTTEPCNIGLVASEGSFRQLVESATVAVCIDSLDGSLRYFNGAFAEMFGYSADELWQHGHATLVHPEDLNRVRSIHEGRLRGEDVPERYEFRGMRRDGSVFHVEVSCSVVHEDGHVIGTRSYLWDISSRKQLETELAESRFSFQAITEHNTEGILVLDEGGRIRFANPAAASMFGRSDLVGSSFGESLVENGAAQIEIAGPDGSQRVAEMRTTETEWFGAAATLVILRDVSSVRVAERQLREQQRLAAVGQLAAGIAHDFNNMLQAITLQAELAARMVEGDSKPARKLGSILKQTERASTLIRQILDFARQTADQRERLLIKPLLKESVKLLRRTIAERVSIELEMAEGELWVVANAGQLRELLSNLAVNAADAMPEGGRLQISVEPREVTDVTAVPVEGMTAGEWLVMTVADTGVGIEKALQERIFEPFFTTKDRSSATGLGLSQVYGIVRQHGGFIAVSSEPGGGTKFTIYLPAPPPEQPTAHDEPQMVAGASWDAMGQTVLLVEDDSVLLEMTKDGLEMLGFEVVTASEGRSALQLIEERPEEISLVLSDVVMPEMGGRELARCLTARGANVGVVLMSGYPVEEDAETLEREGVIAWIQKPFSLDEMARTMQTAGERVGRLRDATSSG